MNKSQMLLMGILIMHSLQWIRHTFALIGLYMLKETEMILASLNSYYSLMIIIVLCLGFISLDKENANKGDRK